MLTFKIGLIIIEVDLEETEKKREEYLNQMKELESLFVKLKEEYIQEKLAMLEKNIQEIENETSPDFKKPLEILQQNRQDRMNIASKC